MNDKLFNLIKTGVCQYNFKPLNCNLDDVYELVNCCNELINQNNMDIEIWQNLFKKYLKIDNNETITNIVSYILNRILKKT